MNSQNIITALANKAEEIINAPKPNPPSPMQERLIRFFSTTRFGGAQCSKDARLLVEAITGEVVQEELESLPVFSIVSYSNKPWIILMPKDPAARCDATRGIDMDGAGQHLSADNDHPAPKEVAEQVIAELKAMTNEQATKFMVAATKHCGGGWLAQILS